MIKKIFKRILLTILVLVPLSSLAISTVQTTPATGIAYNLATLNGIVHGINQSDNNIYRFKYSTTQTSIGGCSSMVGNTANAFLGALGVGGISTMQATVTLSPNTTYYFCAMASDDGGDTFLYGNVLSFSTPSGGSSGGTGGSGGGDVGEVVTVGVSNVTDTEATFDGSVSGVTGSAYGYFRYSTMATPPIFCNDIFGSNMRSIAAGTNITGQNSSGLVGNGSFSARATDLTESTTYYYCAVVSNQAENPKEIKIKYGEVKSVTTPPCSTCPHTKIITRPASVLGARSANLRGEYGSSKGVTTYFEYKPVDGIAQQSQDSGGTVNWIKTTEENHAPNTFGKITFLVNGLQSNTNYTFRAVGETTNPAQTFYGETLTFKTFTVDGFGDGEGWIYDGILPETILPYIPNLNDPYIPYNPSDPYGYCDPVTQDCDGGIDVTCNPVLEDCDGGTDVTCNPAIQNCDGGTDITCNPVTQDCDGGIDVTCNPVTQDCDGNINVICNPLTQNCGGGGTVGGGDLDGDGIINSNDNDMDGDGTGNTSDSDTDGDGIGNGFDSDDDNDGIFDGSDVTPLGNGSSNGDLDGDGISNNVDTDDDGDGIPDNSDATPFGLGSNINDLDGDGVNNSVDNDVDGDGISNNIDTDDDNDGVPDVNDPTPRGRSSSSSQTDEPSIGSVTNPPNDAIVRHHEGVETVFIRQILRNITLQQKYGHKTGDLQSFANYLAHFFGKNFGYVAKNRREVRVRYEDVAAYELREVGNSTIVYESFLSKTSGKFEITGIRKLNSLFKIIFKYEYYFLKRR